MWCKQHTWLNAVSMWRRMTWQKPYVMQRRKSHDVDDVCGGIIWRTSSGDVNDVRDVWHVNDGCDVITMTWITYLKSLMMSPSEVNDVHYVTCWRHHQMMYLALPMTLSRCVTWLIMSDVIGDHEWCHCQTWQTDWHFCFICVDKTQGSLVIMCTGKHPWFKIKYTLRNCGLNKCIQFHQCLSIMCIVIISQETSLTVSFNYTT